LKSFSEDETRVISEMGGIRTNHQIYFDVLILVLASVALPTTFNFIGEFTVCIVFNINIWFAFRVEQPLYWVHTTC
jgi:NADH-quinone oxidoreductase subunit M